MQSPYSLFGSRIHLVLEDNFAEAYNRAQDSFMNAQMSFAAENGKTWNGEELRPDWSLDEAKSWYYILGFIELLLSMNGGALDISEDETHSDYLIKL
jgi:hypothetical protein